MVWNALKNLTRYFPNNAKAGCCSCPHLCVLPEASLCAVAFLFPWFPWKHFGERIWLSGLPLVVSLCASDSTLTFAQQAQCVPFVEIFTRHERASAYSNEARGRAGWLHQHPFLWARL